MGLNGNLEEHIIKLTEQVKELNKRVNDLEVLVDNLRVEHDYHEHRVLDPKFPRRANAD